MSEPEVKWVCGECKDPCDEYTYAMQIDNVQVLEVDEEGRIMASSSTDQHHEQLCYICFQEKYVEPLKVIEKVQSLFRKWWAHLPIGFGQELEEIVGWPRPKEAKT